MTRVFWPASCASDRGASRAIFEWAVGNDWTLVSTPYVLDEVGGNLPRLTVAATSVWNTFQPRLWMATDVLTIDRPNAFLPTKDRPILFSALAWADVLLTLDRADFGNLLNQSFYGLNVLTPGDFLLTERRAGRLSTGAGERA